MHGQMGGLENIERCVELETLKRCTWSPTRPFLPHRRCCAFRRSIRNGLGHYGVIPDIAREGDASLLTVARGRHSSQQRLVAAIPAVITTTGSPGQMESWKRR